MGCPLLKVQAHVLQGLVFLQVSSHHKDPLTVRLCAQLLCAEDAFQALHPTTLGKHNVHLETITNLKGGKGSVWSGEPNRSIDVLRCDAPLRS